jgi:hypothetical protein
VDLSLGTPVDHPGDVDLSLGTPVDHPGDVDLSLGTPVACCVLFHPSFTVAHGPRAAQRTGHSGRGLAKEIFAA